MAAHTSNARRGFLAEEVRAQREEITKLGRETAASSATVTLLLEADRRAGAYRAEMRKEVSDVRAHVEAQRAEQGQVMIGLTGLRTDVEKISKMLTEHENERQQNKGKLSLASASASIAWKLLGILGTAAIAVFGALYVWLTKLGGGHP